MRVIHTIEYLPYRGNEWTRGACNNTEDLANRMWTVVDGASSVVQLQEYLPITLEALGLLTVTTYKLLWYLPVSLVLWG